jgi:L-serine deaminase
LNIGFLPFQSSERTKNSISVAVKMFSARLTQFHSDPRGGLGSKFVVAPTGGYPGIEPGVLHNPSEAKVGIVATSSAKRQRIGVSSFGERMPQPKKTHDGYIISRPTASS